MLLKFLDVVRDRALFVRQLLDAMVQYVAEIIEGAIASEELTNEEAGALGKVAREAVARGGLSPMNLTLNKRAKGGRRDQGGSFGASCGVGVSRAGRGGEGPARRELGEARDTVRGCARSSLGVQTDVSTSGSVQDTSRRFKVCARHF